MRIVLSIGGSVLAPELAADRVREYASVIATIADAGNTVAAVVGGGHAAREYIDTARELGANEMELDRIGIEITRLNARLLIAALGDRAALAPPEDYATAHAAVRRDEIPVMGGTEPAHTTDAVSAALAEEIGADLLVYATSTPGVFEADPSDDDTANRYEEIKAGTLARTIAALGAEAGTNAPVDLLAAKILQRARMEAIVLDGTDPGRVQKAVLEGEYDGTRVVPDGEGTDRLETAREN